ncbi:MAG: hypothetical protein KGL35_27240, partial [Bradyrhizobium sp.]|nr:hypothetical protein [Bradyrhizobium sp.]
MFVDVTGTGGWEERRLPPGKRSHAVSTVEDLIRLALYAAGESVNADPAIWHDEDAVRLVFDQTDPWDCATVGLVKSPQWQMLETLAKRTPLRQREMVNLLRVELAGCLATPRLIGAVSHINFRAASHGSSSIEQGRDSFGSQVEREVAGVKEPIPETETVRLPLYQNVGER